MSEEARIVEYFRENDREIRWIQEGGKDKLIVFLYPFDMEDFAKLVEETAGSMLDDGGWNILMTGTMIIHYCVTISDLCEYIGMDPELILTKKEGERNG